MTSVKKIWITRISVFFIYVLTFGGAMALQANKVELARLLIGIMFILGGSIGYYNKSMFFWTRTEQYNMISSTNHYENPYFPFFAIIINGLIIIMGIGFILSL